MRRESLTDTAASLLAQIESFGEAGGPSVHDTLAAFHRLRAFPQEARAISILLAVHARMPLPEALLVAVSLALVERGDALAASSLLVRATSNAALMLHADILAAENEFVAAIALVERVLLCDFDWPGARERRTRWRATLGVEDSPRVPAAAKTRLTSEPEAPFQLLREVGRGSAGAVYEAVDRHLGRRLALKVYHRLDLQWDQLLDEARVAVSLQSPHIVRIYDVDPEHGWLAIQWVELGALRALLRSRDRRLRRFDQWAPGLARALAHVHAAGWVHHDVKPANVLLNGPSTPLLSDFGTARRIGEPSPPGSLGYVSPERLAGRASHPRDDVFGFGRILEDALDTFGDGENAGFWRRLATECTVERGDQPECGAALVERIERRQERSKR